MNKLRYTCLTTFLIVFMSSCINTNPETNNSSNSTALANPASEKCVRDGGADKVLYGPQGQYGLCLFTDGSVCEEWAYFRGECVKGECNRTCQAINTRDEGWYDCHNKLLYWDRCANETATTAGTC